MTFLVIIMVPVLTLLWRLIASKQHWPVRLGAAVAAMLTFVGALSARDAAAGGFRLDGVRDWVALALCAVGPSYLFLWSRMHRGRKRSKTISLIAAIIGFVPIAAALVITLLYAE
jgi:hypothetical protein